MGVSVAVNRYRLRISCAVVLMAMMADSGAFTAVAVAENWPAWRGPRGDGTSNEKDLATTWNGESAKNILWRVPIPGRGHSSPIVWEDRVLVTTCIEERTERLLLCLDRDTGKTLWTQIVLQGMLEGKRDFNSHASGTPATDGQRVYVTFLEPDGTKVPSEGVVKFKTPGHIVVAAYTMGGKQARQVRPARFLGVNGYSASPVLFKDKVIINADHDGKGYIVALDRSSGKTVWKIDRENEVDLGSFVTPLIRDIGGRTQMVLSGNGCVASFDPNDGARHWVFDGPTMQFVPSPVCDEKRFFICGGHPQEQILAIRPDGHGSVAESHVVWQASTGCTKIPSPILVGACLVVVNDDGIASGFDAETGDLIWRKRIGKKHFASPVLADGHLYVLATDGVTRVFRVGTTLELVAENNVEDAGHECYASPAISGGRIFLRTSKDLYCIAELTDDRSERQARQ